MSNVIGIVYMTTNLVNGRRYIGKHLVSKGYDGSFDGYLGSGTLLKKAISYYGEDKFERITLKECYSIEELEQTEEYYLQLYDCANNPLYYNIINTNHLGGRRSGYHHTEETKRKIGEHSGATRKGKPLSDSHKASLTKSLQARGSRQSELMKGRIKLHNEDYEICVHPEEVGEYLGKGYQRGRLPQNKVTNPELSQYWKGKTQSKETKEKRAESLRGQVYLSKDGKTIRVNSEEMVLYLDEGWVQGMSGDFKEKRSKDVRGKVHIYKGEDQKFIYRDELNAYLEDGWLQGLPPSQREKLRKAAILREAKKRESKNKE